MHIFSVHAESLGFRNLFLKSFSKSNYAFSEIWGFGESQIKSLSPYEPFEGAF